MEAAGIEPAQDSGGASQRLPATTTRLLSLVPESSPVRAGSPDFRGETSASGTIESSARSAAAPRFADGRGNPPRTRRGRRPLPGPSRVPDAGKPLVEGLDVAVVRKDALDPLTGRGAKFTPHTFVGDAHDHTGDVDRIE